MDIAAQIDLAKRYVAERPSDEVLGDMETYAASLGVSSAPSDQITAWTYEIVGNDRTAFYAAMIAHQERMAFRYGMTHLVATSSGPDVDMFERCFLMCAYLHSEDCRTPTVFLDNDAFPNADLRPVFDQIEHVGLTVRHDPGLMPVNEGVIFARPTDEARRFFLSYLATYERLREVMKPDDWRWWGGQLALNAVAEGAGCRMARFLPCDRFNHSPDGPQPRATLDDKLVLHLKGPRKALFDQLVAYQESR